jgi:hypothetical protein
MAMVETTFPLVDALLPRPNLRHLLLARQPAARTEHPAAGHGHFRLRGVRDLEGYHALRV